MAYSKEDFESREAWSNKFLHEAKFVLIGIALATFACYLG